MIKAVFKIFLVGGIMVSCTGEEAPKADADYRELNGEAQGTTYYISFRDSIGQALSQLQSDSIFDAIDQSLSVWVAGSVISSFNENTVDTISDPHFLTMYFRSREISDATGGAFEPMIGPLVKAWGFGPEGAHPKGDPNIDSLRALMTAPLMVTPIDSMPSGNTLAQFRFEKQAGQTIDVNGIAQGYTVDVLCEYLSRRGIMDYMVEVGGEVRAKGMNKMGKLWQIGIDKPVGLEAERELEAIVPLDNRAVATSGSYRKFYERDGRRYPHTIDPATGYPVDHQLLSTTVLAPNCTEADAFATAFMVMGVEKTKQFLEDHAALDLDVLLLFSTTDGGMDEYTSPGLKSIIEMQ